MFHRYFWVKKHIENRFFGKKIKHCFPSYISSRIPWTHRQGVVYRDRYIIFFQILGEMARRPPINLTKKKLNACAHGPDLAGPRTCL